MTIRRSRVRLLLAMTLAILGWSTPLRSQARGIPASLTDKEFWGLTEMVSEANGSFFSDNFLSNERGYQEVIPRLLKTARPGGVYLGVGPEQNFPYIIALEPSLAIIFDVRRGNLQEHLLYKALFELSTDRADFLSRLFSRQRPPGLTATTPIREMMVAYARAPRSDALYEVNLIAIRDLLTKKHGFALHPDDMPGIEHVYRDAFYDGGPGLSMTTNQPVSRTCCDDNGTYGEIQSLTDATGLNRGFLGNEANWRVVRDYHVRNLIVPVVGDFAGPTAIRRVGQYLKERHAVVSAFYLSNVEDWLHRSGTEDRFLCNAAMLPVDAASTFIFTGHGRSGGATMTLNITNLRPMAADSTRC